MEEWYDCSCQNHNYENVSDWFHTFWELYKHRSYLFIALMKKYNQHAYRANNHHDWTNYPWYFLVWISTEHWQISYHLKNEYWELLDWYWIKTMNNWPESDSLY